MANVNVIASIVPNNIQSNGNSIANQEISKDTNELDYASVSEISNYLLEQAKHNNYKFSTIVFSSGLLFESEDILIVVGHGNFDSKGQYSIGDFSTNMITRLAKEKEKVALLSCFSSKIKLQNNLQLTYENEIDIKSAIGDLSTLLNWKPIYKFAPTNNILLDYFDPGDGGGGSYTQATIPFNGLRRAHSFLDGHIYWNLYSSTACTSLKNYMYANLGRLVEFTYTGTFLIEQGAGSGVYDLEYHTLTYDAWITKEGDMKHYMNYDDIERDNSDLGKYIKVKMEDLTEAYDVLGYEPFIDASNTFVTVLLETGLAFLGVWGLAALASKSAWGAIPGFAKVCLVVGIVLVVLAFIAALAVFIVSICWI